MLEPPTIAVEDPQDEITALIRTLHETQQRLQELAGGEVDAVTHPGGHSYMLHEAQEKLRRSEESLQRKQTELQVLFDLVPAMIWFKNTENGFLRVNQRVAEATGLAVDEIEGHSENEIFPLEAAGHYADDLEVIRSGAPKMGMVEKLRGLQGEERWVQTDKVPYCDTDGKVIGLVAMVQDITERQRASVLLVESKQRLALATESARIGIWEWDLVTNRLAWDEQMYALYNTSEANFSNAYEAWLSAIHPDDRKRSETELAASVEGDNGFHAEFRIVWPEGEVRDIEAHAVMQRVDDGSSNLMIGVNWDITERKRTERAIRESEERFRFLNNLAELTRSLSDPAQIVAMTARMLGEHLRASRCAYAEVEKDGEQFTIRYDYTDGCASSVGQYQLSRFGARALTSLQYGQTLIIRDVEAELSSDQGAEMFAAIGIRAIISCPLVKKGGLCAIMAVHQTTPRDWTSAEVSLIQEIVERCWATIERQTSENDLRQSEALLRIAGRAARLGGWSVDLPAIRVHWSDEVCAIHEVPPGTVPDLEQAMGFFAPQSREIISQAFATCAEQGTPFDLELEIITAKGRPAWVRAIGEAQRDRTGANCRVQGAIQDITERRSSENRIVEQAGLIDEARDAIVVRDLNHHIIFWNKGAERLYGWTAEEAQGNVLPELLQMDMVSFKEADKAVRASGAWNGELGNVARSGLRLILDGRWTLVCDPMGRPQSILSIDTDITDRKKIEQQFLRSQRMESIGTLAGGIAHDLNNSLSPIIMSLDLLTTKFTDPESQALLEIVSTSARRGADMVRQVLSFGRGVDGNRQEVQIRHLVRDIEKIVKDTFLKHIQVQARIPNDLWTIEGDATQLHQVLLNLCVNARDAMPSSGKLTISAENLILDAHYVGLNPEAHPGPYILLQVEDTGTGIPPAVIDKIFDPFFTTKAVGQGTGLGLSTSLAIVKSHGGFVRVYSELGKGTTFKLYLPSQTEASSAVSANRAAELPRGHGELILIVDDEPSVRLVTQQTLEAFGYRAVLAADGSEAVAIYAMRRAEIAVVITDMTMPVMDGPATIQVLRKLNSKLPIIAASGLSANDYMGKFAGLDIKHFLPKPYTAEFLLKKLREILQAAA